jgi:hypothetical protein
MFLSAGIPTSTSSKLCRGSGVFFLLMDRMMAISPVHQRIFTPEVAFYNMKGRTTRQGLEEVIEILANPSGTP